MLLVLNVLKELPRGNAGQIAQAAGLSETVVVTVLNRAIESGLVDPLWHGKRTGRICFPINSIRTEKRPLAMVLQRDIDEARYNELIVNMAKNTDFIARADVMNLLHVSESKAYSLLKHLVRLNILEPVNKGRYAKYRLKGV